MFAIKGTSRQLCDGTSRRDFLRVGALGCLGLSLPGWSRAAPTFSAPEAGFGRAKRCVPTFTALPEIIKDDAINEYPGQSGGFLGKQYDPFRVEGDVENAAFRVPDLLLPTGMTAQRLEERRALLPLLDQHWRAVESRAA